MKTVLTLLMTGCLAIAVVTAQSRSTADQFQEALRLEEVKGDLKGAIEQYKKIAEGSDKAIAAKALLRMAGCYEKLGQGDTQKTYERVVREFGAQTKSAATARARLAALQSPAVAQVGQTVRLLSSDLGRWLGNSDVGPPSADGRYLSFTGAWANLALLDLKSGRTRSLTSNKDDTLGYVVSSVVSPDGRQVAYDWDMSPARKEELRVVQVSGGNEATFRSVYLNDGYMDVLGWSPDGKSVLVERDTKTTNRVRSVPA